MSSGFRRALVEALISVLLFLLLVELLLRVFDPWGAAFYAENYDLTHHFVADPTLGYVLSPGTYHGRTWTATELPDETRFLPDNHSGPCRVVLLGDSVTWGYRVNDADAWANRIAAQLPDATFIDAAQIGYNIDQVVTLWTQRPDADVDVYLIIPNDIEPAASLESFRSAPDPSQYNYVYLYLNHFRTALTPGALDYSRLFAGLDAMRADPRVTFVAFDDAFGRAVAARYPVHLIPWYTHPISYLDGHPSAAGHAEIAAALLPIIRQAVQNRCTATF